MLTSLSLPNLTLTASYEEGQLLSLRLGGRERLASPTPLFRLCLRNRAGEAVTLTACDARDCERLADGAVYTGFPLSGLRARILLREKVGEAAWRVEVDPGSNEYFVEWVECPSVNLPPLADNNGAGDGGRILFPYDEGVLVSDMHIKQHLWHIDAAYPSKGDYAVFPNRICAQMLAYLWEDVGLYMGAHDAERGLKEIDFLEEADGVTLRFRLFGGTDFGETFRPDYDVVMAVTDGRWESAAERYRTWFESALPKGVRRITENPALPDWYEDSPLVVTYPVRGVHDTDEMSPNRLFPYHNALPHLAGIREATDSRLLVLLMHWEGTAPWAPPYVWPPFGGEAMLADFRRALREKGDLLGVYCSGFGYAMQSTLIEEYNKEEEYAERALWRGMCTGPDGKVAVSRICTYQRWGYDICPASAVGRELLAESYEPLFENGLDYVQILDQNHGGGQYFCYSRDHGHPPAPGPWMTTHMQALLSEWNARAGRTLFGCESAAAEPFIGNLAFSDNRYELNYILGTPVPLYAYLYHEYVRNFMGNQVGCPFRPDTDTLRYRLAYSFAIGDSMTLVLTQDGALASHWGQRDFSTLPDKEKALRFIGNLTRFYRESAKPYLYAGRMIPTPDVICESLIYPGGDPERDFCLPAVIATAWEGTDGSRAVILVNPVDTPATCRVSGNDVTVPPLNACLLPL